MANVGPLADANFAALPEHEKLAAQMSVRAEHDLRGVAVQVGNLVSRVQHRVGMNGRALAAGRGIEVRRRAEQLP